MLNLKKVMAIHDMSCYGRASLTTIIPILSVMGMQVCPLPTGVLSTHTGGYGKVASVDLSGFIDEAILHWENLNLKFDCIYTGYLANVEQASIIKAAIQRFDSNLVVIDPVMGDHGKLYSSIGQDMILAMRELIKYADVITPNVTEAAFLLDKNYDDIFDFDIVDSWAIGLSDLGADNVVITSAPSRKGKEFIDTISYSKKDDKLTRISVKKIDKHYPGTGDIFASVLVGNILREKTISDAAQIGSQFIRKAIFESSKFDYESREGVLLEPILGELLKIN